MIVHFVKYNVYSVWEYYNHLGKDEMISYSRLKGFINANLKGNNVNVTSAFKGPKETIATVVLEPTSYTSEVSNKKYSGYRPMSGEIQLGDTVNQRSIPLKFKENGTPNAGFAFEIQFLLSDQIYSVTTVQKRSFLESMALICGILAGFVLVARIARHCIKDTEYFRGKDRECNMLFGAPQDNENASKFAIDMAAASHMNRVRAGADQEKYDDKFRRDSEVEMANKEPVQDHEIVEKHDEEKEKPKAVVKQSDKYEEFD